MSAPESWEDMDEGNGHPQRGMKPPGARLNANAPTFSFNPTATAFTPSYGSPSVPPGYYAPPVQYPQQPYVNPQGGPQGYAGYQTAGYQVPGYGTYAPGYVTQGYQQPQGYGQRTGAPPAQQTSAPPPSRHHTQIAPQQVTKTISAPSPTTSAPAPAPVQMSVQQTKDVETLTTVPGLGGGPAPAVETKPVTEALAVPVEQKQSAKEEEPQAPNLAKEGEEWDTEDEKPEVLNGPSPAEVDAAAAKVASIDLKEEVHSKDQSDAGGKHEEAAVDEEEPYKEESKMMEEEPESREEEKEEDPRDHLNLVFIGHVDAGKSTIGGQILYLSGMVDKRTIEKFEREAKDKNRESWYMAYIMDTNEEERAKGKTVEVGRAHFETEKRRYTVLDAPGHKNYVPNMISGASQADIGVLVIAARKGEFETGFERGGQTREHAQLAKTLGVSKLVVVVNKMDDPSVAWSKERFDEIVTKMTPFLKQCGYNAKKDVQFLPISGLHGANMKERVGKATCPWWEGPSFFETLDALDMPERDPRGLFRMPLIDKYRDMGTVVMGKIESGSVRRGDSLLVMPNKSQVKVVTIFRDNDEVSHAKPGENLRIRLQGVEEEDISPGFVLSSIQSPITAVLEFDAQLQILELLDHKAIFTAGYKAVLHIHSIVEECEIIELLQQMDPKTKKWMKKKPLFVKSNAIITARIQVAQMICVEKFSNFPQLGRFTLRDEGKTVAIGKVTVLAGQD